MSGGAFFRFGFNRHGRHLKSPGRRKFAQAAQRSAFLSFLHICKKFGAWQAGAGRLRKRIFAWAVCFRRGDRHGIADARKESSPMDFASDNVAAVAPEILEAIIASS